MPEEKKPAFEDRQEKRKSTISSMYRFDQNIILKEIKNQDRIREFVEFAEIILGFLPEQEKESFKKDPIQFTSETYYFRGLSSEQLKECLETHIYRPQRGEFGSRGVFVTNRPYSAFTYQTRGGL